MPNSQENVEQLLQDDSFVRWINGEADELEERKWKQWLEQDTDRLNVVEKARQIYKSLTFEEENPKTIEELNRLRNGLEEYERNNNSYVKLSVHTCKKKTQTGLWGSAVAILILIIAVSIVAQTVRWNVGVNITGFKKLFYTTTNTEYGQIQRFIEGLFFQPVYMIVH